MWVAQLSDTHVTEAGTGTRHSGDTGVTLRRCIDSVLGMRPPPLAVVVSGDLVSSGAAEEYARLRQLIAPLTMPVYLLPGNHDSRDALRAEFADHAYLPASGQLRYAVDAGALRLIMLDTGVPGADYGALDEEQLGWLNESLATPRPTIVFMHHPPFRTGLRGMDDIALDAESAARFRSVIERHPCVERIACGHVHRVSHARFGGTVATVCPSTAFQARVDFSADWKFVAGAEAPAYHAHYWDGASLITHTISVPE